MIRALIVDDEELARTRIRQVLASEKDVEVIGECGSAVDALRRILDDTPDVVFLDIEMPELTGLEMLETLAQEQALPVIVFITAYHQFAIQAFEVNAVDYILKPFYYPRFQEAMERVRRRLAETERDRAAEYQALLGDLRPAGQHSTRIAVRSGPKITLVNVADVDYVEGEGNYMRLHVGAKSYLIRATMKTLNERLDPEAFIRIHRSLIVNVDRIREIEALFQGSYSILLSSGARLTSSVRYRPALARLFSDWG